MTVTIWHNPRCSKSRQTLQLLEDRGVDLVVRRYLEDQPSGKEIKAALQTLNRAAIDITRRGEKAFKAAGLSKDSSDAALIAEMVANPILIERPIVFANGKAAIGRPPEAVLDIL